MPEFHFKAKSGPNQLVRGTLEAANPQEAIHIIEQKGYIPIEVKPASSAAPPEKAADARPAERRGSPSGRPVSAEAKAAAAATHRLSGGKLQAYQVCVFTRQIAGLIRSHVPLLSALEIVKGQADHPRLKAVLENTAQAVRNGERFSDALVQYGQGSFDARFIGMVRSGESGGALDVILETLADFLEREEEIRGQIRAALAYPILIVLVGTATLFFLFTWCLPKLTNLFSQGYASLPLPTKILIGLSRPGWQTAIWIAFGMFLAFLVSFFAGGEGRKRRLDFWLSRIPYLGELRVKADIARFCGTLSMLIENGITVHQAIEVTRPVLSNEILKDELKGAQDRILSGERVAAVIRDAPHFPAFVANMVAVGEESGQLATTLKEVARFYDRENVRGIKMLTSLIEPAIILALSLVVGFVVSAIMLPIFDMNWIK